MTLLALTGSDTAAPVEIVDKEADGRLIKMGMTGAFLSPQVANNFLESKLLFWFLL